MTPLPPGLAEFVASTGWQDAEVSPLPGDASFRRYFRLTRPNGRGAANGAANGSGGGAGDEAAGADARAMLMHAPPPHENPAPFLAVARWLTAHGLRAPAILAEDAAAGWVLIEDFGDDRMRDWLEAHPQGETAAYEAAIDTLAALHRLPPGPFAPYDMPTYLREAELLTQWFCPAHGLAVDAAGYLAAWEEVLAPLLARQHLAPVSVLRDYHAENIMLLGGSPGAPQGLIDFQDALVGHPAYDLVSILQDARREVSPALEAAMLGRYGVAMGSVDPHFDADYARLGAQRNAKIVGIFTRLDRRDGKPKYLPLIPRVWAALERDLAHPELAPVSRWFDANIPAALRAAGGAFAA